MVKPWGHGIIIELPSSFQGPSVSVGTDQYKNLIVTVAGKPLGKEHAVALIHTIRAALELLREQEELRSL